MRQSAGPDGTGRLSVPGLLQELIRILDERPRVGDVLFAALGALLTLSFAPFNLYPAAVLLV